MINEIKIKLQFLSIFLYACTRNTCILLIRNRLLLTHFVVRTLKLCKIQTFNIPARIQSAHADNALQL